MNTDKTNIVLIDTNGKLRNVNEDDFHVVIYNEDIREVKKAKYLGVLIDNELKWHKQVNSVTQKVFGKLSLIRRLKLYLDINTLNPCSPEGFSQTYFPKGGLLQTPLWIINTEGRITLNLLPVYRYGHPLSIDTKISTNH